jgi:hypothetical protein
MREYIWYTDESTWAPDGSYVDVDKLNALAEDWLDEHEGDEVAINVWLVSEGQASGIYEIQANGNWQILGYSISVPEDVHDLTDRAWEYALERYTEDEED